MVNKEDFKISVALIIHKQGFELYQLRSRILSDHIGVDDCISPFVHTSALLAT